EKTAAFVIGRVVGHDIVLNRRSSGAKQTQAATGRRTPGVVRNIVVQNLCRRSSLDRNAAAANAAAVTRDLTIVLDGIAVNERRAEINSNAAAGAGCTVVRNEVAGNRR